MYPKLSELINHHLPAVLKLTPSSLIQKITEYRYNDVVWIQMVKCVYQYFIELFFGLINTLKNHVDRLIKKVSSLTS